MANRLMEVRKEEGITGWRRFETQTTTGSKRDWGSRVSAELRRILNSIMHRELPLNWMEVQCWGVSAIDQL